MEYETFRDFGPHGVESVEVKIPVFGSAAENIPPLLNSGDSDSPLVLTDLTLEIYDADPSAPYWNYWTAATLEDEQLYFNVYEITTSDNETTRTDATLVLPLLLLISIICAVNIRKRKG